MGEILDAYDKAMEDRKKGIHPIETKPPAKMAKPRTEYTREPGEDDGD